MTDQELIDLVEQKLSEDLAPDESSLLRRRLRDSPKLREALVGRLQIEQFLGDSLGGVQVSVDRILAAGAADPAGLFGSPYWRWGARALALSLVAALATVVYFADGADRAQTKTVASSQPGGPQARVGERRAKRQAFSRWRVASENQTSPHSASETQSQQPPKTVEPVAEPAPQETAVAAVPTTPAIPANPAVEANPPPLQAEQPPAVPEGPWQQALRDGGPLPKFTQIAFDDFPATQRGVPVGELKQWLVQVPGEQQAIHERQGSSPVIEGWSRLQAPWPADAGLRLSLYEHHNLKLHCFNGQQGVTFQYYEPQRQTWAAYTTTRNGEEPRPATYALAGTDCDRYRRSGAGTVELRYHQGQLVMSRGNVRLVGAPLEGPPRQVFFEGRAAVRGIGMFRSATPAAERNPRRVVLSVPEPASREWQTALPEGARFQKLEDGRIELAAEKSKEPAQSLLSIDKPGLYELVLQVRDALPGSGVVLADEQGAPLYRVGFFRDQRTGWTSFGFLRPGENRTDSQHDIQQQIAPYAGSRQWLRLVVGCGTVKCWTSGDGMHWGRPFEPLVDNQGMKPFARRLILPARGNAAEHQAATARSPGVHCAGLAGSARAGQSRFGSSVEKRITLEKWLAAVRETQPEDIDALAWQRACAVRTLLAGPPAPLGNELLKGLLDEALPRLAKPEDKLRLLDEVALWSDTWQQSHFAKLLMNHLAGQYEQVGHSLARSGHPQSYTVVNRALIVAPIWTDWELDVVPEGLLRQELLGLVYRDDWQRVRRFCQRVKYWNRAGNPDQRPAGRRDTMLRLVEWADSTSRRYLPDQPAGDAVPLPAQWRHPLVREVSKEAYNILAEFNAALESHAYQDACQIISTANTQGAMGLLPDTQDPKLLVSLASAVKLAMREHPPLKQMMDQRFGPAGRLRIRQAIEEGDLATIEAATVQFTGTEAAGEAHLWLGDRALANGDFAQAIGQYQQAADSAAALDLEPIAARVRLASAMLGRDEGQAVAAPVRLGEAEIAGTQFEALVAEMRQAHAAGSNLRPTTTAAQQPQRGLVPAGYASQPWSRLQGNMGHGSNDLAFPGPDWVARQLATAIAGDTLIVSNRFQITAYDLNNAQVRWSTALDGRQGHAHKWPMVSMPPVVAGDRIFLRRLTAEGPELACLKLDNGQVVWSSRPGDHVASDPLLIQEQLFALTVAVDQDKVLQVLLTTFDPATGAALAERPLARVRDNCVKQLPCRATAVNDKIIASFGGSVLCCDVLGQPLWLRRQTWLPPAQEPTWGQQFHETPLVRGRQVYICQPSVRAIDCLELDSGRLLWRQTLPELQRIVGLTDTRLIAETRHGLVAFDAGGGKPLWHYDDEDLLDAHALGEPGGLMVARRTKADNNHWQPELVWLDLETGQPTAKAPVANLAHNEPPLLGPLVVRDNRAWVFFGRGPREPNRELLELIPSGSAQPIEAITAFNGSTARHGAATRRHVNFTLYRSKRGAR